MEHEIGKEETFESIYRTYETCIYRLCLSLTRNEEDAKELSQRTFFEFYLRMDNINLELAGAYLSRTAKNLAYNMTRDNRRRAYEELEELDESTYATMSVEDAYIEKEEKAEKNGFGDSILDHVQKKNPSWHQVLFMAYCLNMSQIEIAHELGISKEVVYSRIHRAKEWLLKNYKEEYDKLSLD